MSGLVFYTIDTESNGLKKYYHDVIEISIIRNSDRVQLSKKIICMTPERSSIDALRVTGKTMYDLTQGEENSKVVAACNKFFNEDGGTPESRCLIGHNVITFDSKMLHAMWEKEDQVFPASLYCDTLSMTKAYVKQNNLGKQKTNLKAASELMGITKFANAHSAKGDSRQNYLLFKKLTEEKGMDYLPFIKTLPHVIKKSDYEEPDLSIFDDLEDDDMPF